MREIKFRAWNPRHRQFRYWGFAVGIFNGIPTGAGLTIEECKLNSQQFTGLKDKTGKEIYEGDVVEFAIFDMNDHDEHYTGIVAYEGSRFVLINSVENVFFKGSDGPFDLDWVLGQYDECAIIGNIHENPELLKQDAHPAQGVAV
jgi:uncharacterized phage protein (TIGR01671 family)